MTVKWSCPIWNTPAMGDGNVDSDGIYVNSPRAGGEYIVSGSMNELLKRENYLNEQERSFLTTWLVDQRQSGTPCPKITNEIIERVKAQKDLQIEERVDRILRYLKTKAPRISDRVIYRVFREPVNESELNSPEEGIYLELLAHSESIKSDELTALLNHSEGSEYITYEKKHGARIVCILTVDGHLRLEKLSASLNTENTE